MSRVPLHRLILTNRKTRLVFSMAGVAIAVLIMFMEIGFFNGLIDSQSSLPPLFNADLVLLSNKRVHLNKSNKFYRATLYRTLAFDEVTEVIPVYEARAPIKNLNSERYNTISVLAYPAGSRAILQPELARQDGKLKMSSQVLFDHLSRGIYGKVRSGSEVEIGGVKYQVGGLFDLGPSFTRNGWIVVASETWLSRHRYDLPHRLSFGFIKVKPGVDVARFKQKVSRTLPEEVVVMTPEEIRRREVNFITYSTPVGAVFGLGLVVGFIIGIIVCYQILYNEIMDNLDQYATLKAVGFSNRYLLGMVLKESLYISVMGFVPGLLAGMGLYLLLENLTSIIMHLNPWRVMFVFGLTVLMCIIAGLLAVRKAMAADPAELF